jgi:predicted dehydrogenase
VDEKLTFGLIGAGTMGLNHARVIASSDDQEIGPILDPSIEQVKRLTERFGGYACSGMDEILACDAVVVACPTKDHFEYSRALLKERVPVLVEKPLTLNLEETTRLCEMAEESQSVLMCGFVERFNPAVKLVMELLTEPPLHVIAQRHSPADQRSLGSVVYDLLIHDIDLVLRIGGGEPVQSVLANAWKSEKDQFEIADSTLKFDSGGLATLSASRMGQRKIRTLSVLTRHELFEVDLLRADVTVYRNIMQEQPEDSKALTYRSETVIDIPFVRHGGEPLALEHQHFVNLIRGLEDRKKEIESIYAPHDVADQIEHQCAKSAQEPKE